jgi:hypothetical protein
MLLSSPDPNDDKIFSGMRPAEVTTRLFVAELLCISDMQQTDGNRSDRTHDLESDEPNYRQKSLE